jgi:hypothetical protein
MHSTVVAKRKATSQVGELEDDKNEERRVRRNIRRRMIKFPTLVKHDIRRQYLSMLFNIMNSNDGTLMKRFFDSLCVPGFGYFDQNPDTLMTEFGLAPLVHVSGTDCVINCLQQSFLFAPDTIMRMATDGELHSKFLVFSETKSEDDVADKALEVYSPSLELTDSYLMARYNFNCTVICELKPEWQYDSQQQQQVQKKYQSSYICSNKTKTCSNTEVDWMKATQLLETPFSIQGNGQVMIEIDKNNMITSFHFVTQAIQDSRQA